MSESSGSEVIPGDQSMKGLRVNRPSYQEAQLPQQPNMRKLLAELDTTWEQHVANNRLQGLIERCHRCWQASQVQSTEFSVDLLCHLVQDCR